MNKPWKRIRIQLVIVEQNRAVDVRAADHLASFSHADKHFQLTRIKLDLL